MTLLCFRRVGEYGVKRDDTFNNYERTVDKNILQSLKKALSYNHQPSMSNQAIRAQNTHNFNSNAVESALPFNPHISGLISPTAPVHGAHDATRATSPAQHYPSRATSPAQHYASEPVLAGRQKLRKSLTEDRASRVLMM